MASLTRKLRHLFRRLGLGKSKSSEIPQGKSRLCQLPVDLFLEVLDCLSLPSKICLGMTCKGLWAYISNNDLANLKKDEAVFLSLLEILELSCPRLCLCYECKVLHKWSPDKRSLPLDHGFRRICENAGSHLRVCDHYYLSHETRSLALKAREISPKHGIPLSALKHACHWPANADALTGSLRVVPRIAAQHLLVRLEYTAHIDPMEDFEFQLPLNNFGSCDHNGAEFYKHCVDRLNGFLYDQVDSDLQEKWGSYPRCMFCATETQTRIQMKGVMRWVLRVRVWKDLGARGPPNSQPWKGHVTPNALPRNGASTQEPEWRSISPRALFEQGER